MMKCYFAPMEGITGYLYRNAHHAVFGGVDQYFSPFISPGQNRGLTPKEQRDILPENNVGIHLIPQLLTNRSEAFIRTAKELKQYGYEEVNLNLGCPSGTVVSKYKGAGFLSQPEQLNQFLYEVFSGLDMKISLKTRLGMFSHDEFYELIEIFNQYPVKELIIHPRIRNDFYKNKPDLRVFEDILPISKNPVCYNGDLFTPQDMSVFSKSFPQIQMVMCGRGLVANPALAEELKALSGSGKNVESQEGRISGCQDGRAGGCQDGRTGGSQDERTGGCQDGRTGGCQDGRPLLTKDRLWEFQDRIYHGYADILSGDRNVLFKMKELWSYMICMFADSASYAKKLRKAERLEAYEAAVQGLFRECELEGGAGYRS